MNHQRIHRFCLALMLAAMLVRLAGQVQAYLDWKHSLAPTLWRVDIDAAPTELVCRTPLPRGFRRFRLPHRKRTSLPASRRQLPKKTPRRKNHRRTRPQNHRNR